MPDESAMHASARKVVDALKAKGVVGPFREFSDSTKTAADAAAALACELGAIASCLVFVLDDDPVVVIKSGAFRVDTKKFTQLVGATTMRQANAEEVRRATGQPIGGVSPVNWPGPLHVYIDRSLADFAQLWAACGTPNCVFGTSYEELRRLTGATPIHLDPPGR